MISPSFSTCCVFVYAKLCILVLNILREEEAVVVLKLQVALFGGFTSRSQPVVGVC